jgi:hypothetical protein
MKLTINHDTNIEYSLKQDSDINELGLSED